jgi:predicted regulator of Ras-like GTPase activity (Roadblock/LC7/MglB family)
MKDLNLKVELERIVNDLGKVDGVEGSLIIDSNGNILSQRILQDIDTGLFGPMAHVITSSSKRLLNSSNQGDIQRILVESENGKALFLHLGNVQFIVLMKNRANVGLIMVSSKRAAEKIIELTKDLEIVAEENISITPEPIQAELISDEHKEIISEKLEPEKIIAADIPEQTNEIVIDNEIISSDSNVEEKVEIESVKPEIPKEEIISEDYTAKEVEIDSDVKPEITIPVIKPPIAFPDIKKVVDIPENINDRSDLILDIYEAIFRAMSIGASKIMGVAPARGLTQKFLPSEQCKKLLNGVNVKSNSTIDFTKIRENANNIPIEERESQLIEDFTRIIDVVTDNYGKVMGYGAFRGMVRPEFKIITNSYGPVMKKIGITAKMHPEMSELFE